MQTLEFSTKLETIRVSALHAIALGFYHQARSQAAPLALDLIEIFRVPLVDMTVMASVNRNQWDVKADFEVRGKQVWLSEVGKRKFVELYERRKQESWKVTNL